jgi:hypothetical protein
MIRRRITATNGPHEDGEQPSSGRDSATGRFTQNNRFGRGNPYSREQARIQAAIKAQMSDEELEKFVKSWIQKAKAGKGVYLLSLLDRWAGRVADWSVEERIAALEARLMDATEQPQAIAMTKETPPRIAAQGKAS